MSSFLFLVWTAPAVEQTKGIKETPIREVKRDTDQMDSDRTSMSSRPETPAALTVTDAPVSETRRTLILKKENMSSFFLFLV